MASTSNTTFVEQTLDGITGLEFNVEQMDLRIETSDQTELLQMAYAPVDNAPQLQHDGTTLRIDQNGRYKGNKPAIVTVPAGHTLAVAGNVGAGDLAVSGIVGPLALNVGKGDVAIGSGSGDLAINIGKGDISVGDREGDLAVQVGAGDISLTRCNGDITIRNGAGDATVVDSEGTLNMRVSKGDISILRPTDMSLNIRNANGDVILNDGSVTSLHVKVAKGDIVSRTRLLYTGNVVDADDIDAGAGPDIDPDTMEDVARIVDVSDQGVRFNLGGIQFQAGDDGVSIMSGGQEIFRANDDGVEVRRRDGREIFTATSEGAHWDGGGLSSSGQYSFETSRGDIMIDIPDNLPARVELLSGSGSVTSDIPLVEVGRPGPRGATRRFVGVSAGGDRDRILVTARTHRGELRVRTRSQAAASAPRRAAPSGKSRDERRKAVLEALSQGKLNVEEAHVLLAAIERER